MTTDRPYRKALSSSAARTELTRVAGSQPDPDIVHAFLAVIDDPHYAAAAG
jgi:HD-GYP domain-containing protein (c-di-GMP phosphodiesterase class II)